jgi:hypothetical protein
LTVAAKRKHRAEHKHKAGGSRSSGKGDQKKAEPKGKSDGKNDGKNDQPTARARPRPKVPFPHKAHPPSETEFLARLPLPIGKRFEAVRTFMKKQKGVAEDLYFYGPKTGWAFRYLRGAHSLATVMIHDDHLLGIVSLEADVLAAVDFARLSQIGQRAHAVAHGSPSLLWLDIPLDGAGAADFKILLKAKLNALPVLPPPPPPPRIQSPSSRPPPPPPPPRRPKG